MRLPPATGQPVVLHATWGILGTIILIFLVIHLRDFFYELKFGDDDMGVDANGNVNLYKEVVATFDCLPYTAIVLRRHVWFGISFMARLSKRFPFAGHHS
jgi:hypothetical protein